MGIRAIGTVLALLTLAGCSGSSGEEHAQAPDPSAGQSEGRDAPAPRPMRGSGVLARVTPEQQPPAPDTKKAAAQREKERVRSRRYPLYGVAYHFLARVFARPDGDSEVVGYMRRGARFRAGRPRKGSGCEGDWHAVPGDGYVCPDKGYLIGRTPKSFDGSPLPPALDDPLPYTYAWVAREDVPQYWRMPSAEEEKEAASAIAARRKWEQAQADSASRDGGVPLDGGVARTGFDEETGNSADAGAATQDAGPPLPDHVRMAMRKGFYVSVDREDSDGARRFLRTVRGGYLPREALVFAEGPELSGLALGGPLQLPVAFVHRGGARRLERDPASGRLRNDGHLERHDSFVVADELERRGRTYLVAREGWIVSASAARVARPVARPDDVPEGAQWIHVDLSEQTLTAYEGHRPVYATLVSTGKKDYETPTGLWRIQSKHVSNTMDDLDSADAPYLIEDVPWAMFFEGSYALHGAFWHSGFGRVRSHGCVNLAPADAHWLFRWATPTLPAAWHGVIATAGRDGTWIHIVE